MELIYCSDDQAVVEIALGDKAAQHLFAFAFGVAVRGIEGVSTELEIAIEDSLRLVVVRSPTVVAEGHGTQGERADAQARTPQGYVFVHLHDCRSPCAVRGGAVSRLTHLTSDYAQASLVSAMSGMAVDYEVSERLCIGRAAVLAASSAERGDWESTRDSRKKTATACTRTSSCTFTCTTE